MSRRLVPLPCPSCQSCFTYVSRSKKTAVPNIVKRHHICKDCQHAWYVKGLVSHVTRTRPNTHPFVAAIFAEIKTQKTTMLQVARCSGVGHNTIHKWSFSSVPTLINIEAVLNALGFELILQKKEVSRGAD